MAPTAAGPSATLASANPGTLCPVAPGPPHLPGRYSSQASQNALAFLAHVPGAYGIERGSTSPGSLGTSLAAALIFNLPPANSTLNASSTLTSRYINVHLRDSKQRLLQRQLSAPSTPYQQGIEQLSKDLQSGNLSAAQSDFATLQKAFSPSPSSTAAASAASTSNPVAQAFNQLASDLHSGNLSAAQRDFSALQQDLEKLGGPGATNRFHHYHRLSTNIEDLTNPNSLLQDLNQVRQDLTSGNLFAAQQAYATLRAQAPVSTAFGLRQTEPPVSGPPTSVGGLVDPELIGPPISVLA